MREVCLFCGFPTPDPGMCQRCRRSLPVKDNSNKSDNEKEDTSSPEVCFFQGLILTNSFTGNVEVPFSKIFYIVSTCLEFVDYLIIHDLLLFVYHLIHELFLQTAFPSGFAYDICCDL